MNDGDDDEDEDDFENGKAAFDSDDEDDLLDNTGINEGKSKGASDSVDMFDTLKSEDDVTPQKVAPTKRKLGNKPEVVKPPTKRTKKSVVSDSDGASPVKVNTINGESHTSHMLIYQLDNFTGSKTEKESHPIEQR